MITAKCSEKALLSDAKWWNTGDERRKFGKNGGAMYAEMNANEDAITADERTSIVAWSAMSENEVCTISGKYGVIRVRKAPVAR